jgi:hypothetical protein
MRRSFDGVARGNRRMANDPQPWLEDFSAGAAGGWTFVRSSGAEAEDPRAGFGWYQTIAPSLANNVPRVLPDGSILIEGARTNRVVRSAELGTAPWGGDTGQVSSGQADPRGGTSGCRVNLSAAQTVSQVFAGDVAASRVTTIWLRQGPGTGAYKIYAVRVGSLGQQINGTAPAAWARFNTAIGGTTNGANPDQVSRMYFDGRGSGAHGFGAGPSADDFVGFGAQSEDGLFATSYIPTTSGEATRAHEFESLAAAAVPTAIKSGRVQYKIAPEWTTAQASALHYIRYFDANNYLAIATGNTLRCRANGVDFDRAGITFAANVERTVTVDFIGDTLAIDGLASVALTNDWSGASAALNVGSDGTTGHFFGVLGRALRL